MRANTWYIKTIHFLLAVDYGPTTSFHVQMLRHLLLFRPEERNRFNRTSLQQFSTRASDWLLLTLTSSESSTFQSTANSPRYFVCSSVFVLETPVPKDLSNGLFIPQNTPKAFSYNLLAPRPRIQKSKASIISKAMLLVCPCPTPLIWRWATRGYGDIIALVLELKRRKTKESPFIFVFPDSNLSVREDLDEVIPLLFPTFVATTLSIKVVSKSVKLSALMMEFGKMIHTF